MNSKKIYDPYEYYDKYNDHRYIEQYKAIYDHLKQRPTVDGYLGRLKNEKELTTRYEGYKQLTECGYIRFIKSDNKENPCEVYITEEGMEWIKMLVEIDKL